MLAGFCHMLFYHPRGSSPSTTLLAGVLRSLLLPHVFLCFRITSMVNRTVQKGFAAHLVLSLQQPESPSTPAIGKQQIPFPKTPFINSLLQGLPTIRPSC